MTHKWAQRGFTLLELIVAVGIFAIMSAMAFAGLTSVLTTTGSSDVQQARLAQVQLAVSRLERDLEQVVNRPVSGPFGDVQPALTGTAAGVEFTRAGRPNPLALERSNLQRVLLEVKEDRLLRTAWPVVDRPPGAEPPDPRELLDLIDEAGVRFLDNGNEWTTAWPPTTATGEFVQGIPKAVEIRLVLRDWGEVRRLIVLAGGG